MGVSKKKKGTKKSKKGINNKKVTENTLADPAAEFRDLAQVVGKEGP